jgi:hypothetical protein
LIFSVLTANNKEDSLLVALSPILCVVVNLYERTGGVFLLLIVLAQNGTLKRAIGVANLNGALNTHLLTH